MTQLRSYLTPELQAWCDRNNISEDERVELERLVEQLTDAAFDCGREFLR